MELWKLLILQKESEKYIVQTKTPQYAQVTADPEVVWNLWSLIFVKKDKK